MCKLEQLVDWFILVWGSLAMCVAVFRLSCIQLKSFSGCQKTCGSDSSGTWRATFGEDSPTIWSSISCSSSASNFICCSCSNLAMNFWNRDGSIPSSSAALSSEKSLMESEARQKEAKKGRRISRRWWGATMVVEGGRLQLEPGENPYITKSAILWSALRRRLVRVSQDLAPYFCSQFHWEVDPSADLVKISQQNPCQESTEQNGIELYHWQLILTTHTHITCHMC